MTNSLDRKITLGSLLKFAAPTITSTFLMEIYGIIDGLFVVHLIGTDALSAVNITFPLILVTIAIGMMFGTGGSALVARQLGQKRELTARQNFSLTVLIALGAGILFSVLGLVFLKPLLIFLGANEQLFSYCYEYAYVCLFFMPLALFTGTFSMFYITRGRAVLGLIFSSIGGITNVVLDYVFIAVCDMGLSGAALATGIGYALAGTIGFVYFSVNRSGSLYFVKPKFKPYVIAKICINGSSEMVTNLSVCLVTILLNNIVIRLTGSDGVAAITVVLYMQTLLMSVCFGYSMGIAPLTSYNYGKRETQHLQKIFSISTKMIGTISVFVFLLCLWQSGRLIGLFVNADTVVYKIAARGFKLFAVCFLFMGLNIYASALFTALSNGKISALLSFCRTFVFVVGLLLLLPLWWKMTGVWLAIPISEAMSFLMTLFCFWKYKDVYRFA
ncbi:MAG: MATE family efflux transporter [Alphaproteobacteria bacterium]